jgi:hypothetical protein
MFIASIAEDLRYFYGYCKNAWKELTTVLTGSPSGRKSFGGIGRLKTNLIKNLSTDIDNKMVQW